MRLPFPAEAPLVAAAPLTREIFGNIPPWAQGLFYGMAIAAVALWVYGVARRVALWRHGKTPRESIPPRIMLGRIIRDVLAQGRLRGRIWASTAHKLMFSGFVVLFVGTLLIGVEHWLADLLGRAPNDPVFHKGVYFGAYELTLDLFGIAFLAGCAMLLVRRLRAEGSFAKSISDTAILVLLLAIGVTGYVVEGLRIIIAQTPLAGLSPIGYLVARGATGAALAPATAAQLHFALWWFHAILALGFIAIMPFTRLLHSIAGALNLAIRDHAFGVLSPVSLAEVEATGVIGAATLDQFSRRQLLELDACVSCGRCQDACPAFEAGKPLSPRNVVQDLAAVMGSGGFAEQILPGETISAETLWSCTTCGACAEVCPLGISPLRMIADMRRHLIGEGALRGAPASALQKTERAGNPWGLAPADRLAWAAGLDVPVTDNTADFDILYWVGCAAAYDRRVQKIARSVVRLLQAARVRFAVLGPEERCTGESARRMGDELLFQQLAEQNVETLARRKIRRIVAHCPHCVNSLRNDYSQLGGAYEVLHHSQLLSELIAEGRLPRPPAQSTVNGRSVTFHDPCYLARAAGETAAPRAVLAAAGGSLPIIEPARSARQTACCGAGGGRMWFDDPVAERVGRGRLEELAASGAETVAVACPFCLIMLGDGMAAIEPRAEVKDIAELLADSLLGEEGRAGA